MIKITLKKNMGAPLWVGLSALAGLPAKTSDGLKQSLHPSRRSPATTDLNSKILQALMLNESFFNEK